jgi:hypothetical protein
MAEIQVGTGGTHGTEGTGRHHIHFLRGLFEALRIRKLNYFLRRHHYGFPFLDALVNLLNGLSHQ